LPDDVSDEQILFAIQKQPRFGERGPFAIFFRCDALLSGPSLLDALVGQVVRLIDAHE
jgi:hypothetical protein